MDDRTTEAINNLASMFSNIDKEMITDIFLGCKKDFDKTVDQLIGMGAEQEKKPHVPQFYPPVPSSPKPSAPPVVIPVAAPKPTYVPPVVQVEPVSPVVTPKSPTIETPVAALDVTNLANNPLERKRLELLNQQLTQEYNKLSEIQASNLAQEKHLAQLKDSLVAERNQFEAEKQKLEDEKQVLLQQQDNFQQDKRKLEEHLSFRLRDMKEQMRRNDEELRVKEEAVRRREESKREEERRLEEEARATEKAERKEAKEKRKEEKRALKHAAMEGVLAQREAYIEMHIRSVSDEFAEKELILQEENDRLRKAVAELEQSIAAQHKSAQDTTLSTLLSVTSWLNNSVTDLIERQDTSPAAIKQQLLESLQHNISN